MSWDYESDNRERILRREIENLRRQQMQISSKQIFRPALYKPQFPTSKPKKVYKTMRKIVIGGTPEDVLRIEKPKKYNKDDFCNFCESTGQIMFRSKNEEDDFFDICVNCVSQLYPMAQKEKLKS